MNIPHLGNIIIVKRNGKDGPIYPVNKKITTIGRSESCDIRIQLPVVSNKHCEITCQGENQCTIRNISKTNNTKLNNIIIPQDVDTQIKNKDIITIGDRHLRWETT